MDKTNPRWPFATHRYGSWQGYAVSVDDRLRVVRERMDREMLEAALNVTGLQKTVERAIRSRLRKLGER